MPAAYEAMRDKFNSQGLSLPAAKTKAAKIYNSTHHDNPVTRSEPTMNKGYQGATAKYAEGGAVLGKTSEFMKSEDQFRAAYHKDPGAGADKPYGKSGINSGTGEVKPPAAKGKSLSPVKPRK
jgi:hypothetical protein